MADQRDLQYRIYYLEDQITELLNEDEIDEDEIEKLKEEIKECTEILDMLERAASDSCGYDGWDEVFTGGDY